MRLILILSVILIATAATAQAAPQREVKVERQSTGRGYTTPGTVFQNDLRRGWLPQRGYDDRAYGNPWYGWPEGNRFHRHHGQRHYRQRPGLSLRYDNGDWSAELNTGFDNRYRRGYYSSRNYGYVYGDGWLSDSYWVGDRPVYVYGDTRGLERSVITPRRSYGPVYTAPDYPEYGYYGGEQYSAAAYAEPAPQVYNDNRVYNYYYGDEPQGSAPARAPRGGQPEAAPSAPAATAPLERAFGQRFSESLSLQTPDAAYRFALRDGAIFAGTADGKPTRLSDSVDSAFGGYAAWLPGSGVCLFYRVGDQLCLAYPSDEDARWVHEPLPYSVRFGPDTSIGLVGGLPWLSFSTQDGSRYVVRFTGAGWEEVGSGKR